ncbi:MAG: hypothetical protein JW966_13095 [Anaerolineae bacterium]|nr:hypothetical protein [Anaerolineae bacterium]
MKVRRIALVCVVLVVLLAVAVPALGYNGLYTYYFTGVSSSQTSGSFSVYFEMPEKSVGSVTSSNSAVVAFWGDTFLGMTHFNILPYYAISDTYSGTVDYEVEVPCGEQVKFELYFFMSGLMDTAYATVDCGAKPDAVIRPAGCGALDGEPGAVVGQVVAETIALWAPKADAVTHSPAIVLKPGQTLWVYGVDSTGMFQKVSLGCTYLWVPVGSMGPNPDKVWNNAGLPGQEVK